MFRHIPIWMRFLPVVLLVLLSDALFVVNQTTQAIVLRLGEYRRIHNDPGLKIKIPFIEEVLFYETRILDYDLPSISVTTQDQKFSFLHLSLHEEEPAEAHLLILLPSI